MKGKLLIAAYIVMLGFWLYWLQPTIASVAYVDDEGIITSGGASLWEMKGVLAWFCASFGVLILLVLAAIHSWFTDIEDKERETKYRQGEEAFEERRRQMTATANEMVAEAHSKLERATQAAEEAEAREVTARARAKKVREESEQAQRNVREQLKRLKKERAKLKAELKAQRMLN